MRGTFSVPGRLPVILASGLLCLIWGTTWAVIQVGLEGIPPFSGVALRFAIAAVLLLAVARIRGVRLGRKPRERWLWLVNGTLSFALAYGLVYWGEQWVPSGLSAVLFAVYPFFVAILAHLFLPAERLRGREALGVLIGFGGVGVIFSEDVTVLGGPNVAAAAAVLLLSPLSSAGGSVAVKRWGGGIHPLSIAAMSMAVGAVFSGVLALTFERGSRFQWDGASIPALLYLAVAGSAVTFTIYYWLLSHLPAKRLAFIAYVIPVVAVAVGSLRGESLTARTFAGSALVILGVAIAVRRN